MFDFVTAILNAIVRLTPKALASRREARKRELGARLFQLYLSVYELVSRGETIISELKMARSVMESPDPEAQRWWTIRLERLLREQSLAFGRFEEAIVSYGACLAVLDPESFGTLRWRIEAKEGRLGALQYLLRKHNLPVEGPGELEGQRGPMTVNDAVAWLSNFMSSPLQWNEKVDVGAVDLTAVVKIEAYLRVYDPERDLATIRELLKTLRKALDENFTVSDILLEFADLTTREGLLA